MEVKPGYKHTEVGVIPEEWSALRVCEFGSVITGGTPRTEIQGYWNGSYPWVTPTDITDQRDMWASERMISESGLRSIRQLPADSVLVTCIASIGKNAILRSVGGCNQQINAVVPLQEQSPEFLYYSFESSKQYLLANAGMTATRILSKAAFEQLRFPNPPLPEQRAIAAALSDVDALLGGLDRLIAKKRDLKQAAMQQLLTGQTRLPGFSGAWEVKRVLELGDVVTGGTPRTDVAEFWGDEYPWVTPTDISTRRDMFSSDRWLTKKGLDAVRELPPNTVLVTCIASIGKNAILRTTGACNQQINAVIPNRSSDAGFLYYLFEASKQYLLANAGITATSIISKAAFSELTFRAPLLEEQTAIATVLSDMDAELAALEARRDKTRDLKQAMMQELLTGKTRLVKSEAAHA